MHAYWRFGCAKTFKGVSPEREYVVKNGLRVYEIEICVFMWTAAVHTSKRRSDTTSKIENKDHKTLYIYAGIGSFCTGI